MNDLTLNELFANNTILIIVISKPIQEAFAGIHMTVYHSSQVFKQSTVYSRNNLVKAI